MSGCLADVVAALVDGELDHAAREKAQRHLLHCDACRAEVDVQRRLKARLRSAGEPAPSDALTARLLGLPATTPLTPPDEPVAPRSGSGPEPPGGPPATARPVPARAAARAGAGGRPHVRRRTARRSAVGGAVAVLGVTATLALGAPPQRPASTPLDPASEAFVTEFVSTTSDGVSGPISTVPAAGPEGGATFVPLTSSALLSSGGGRSGR